MFTFSIIERNFMPNNNFCKFHIFFYRPYAFQSHADYYSFLKRNFISKLRKYTLSHYDYQFDVTNVNKHLKSRNLLRKIIYFSYGFVILARTLRFRTTLCHYGRT